MWKHQSINWNGKHIGVLVCMSEWRPCVCVLTLNDFKTVCLKKPVQRNVRGSSHRALLCMPELLFICCLACHCGEQDVIYQSTSWGTLSRRCSLRWHCSARQWAGHAGHTCYLKAVKTVSFLWLWGRYEGAIPESQECKWWVWLSNIRLGLWLSDVCFSVQWELTWV